LRSAISQPNRIESPWYAYLLVGNDPLGKKTQEEASVDLSGALQIEGLSDVGRVRPHNEDCFVTKVACGLVVLADGMGGYNAGEVASGLATALLARGVEAVWPAIVARVSREESKERAEHLLREEIQFTNQAIYRKAENDPNCAGMGTTLVAGLFYDNFVTVAHIGDSRLYRLRRDMLSQMTRDHSLLQEQLDNGFISPEDAQHSHNKNLVTRALGVDALAEPEIHCYEVMPGDFYLFCSDGLNDAVSDDDIRLLLLRLAADPAYLVHQLVQSANSNGGRDNISVVLVKVLSEFDAVR
jgi:protein phosphatase